MTQEHLRNLIERAVEKANADNMLRTSFVLAYVMNQNNPQTHSQV